MGMKNRGILIIAKVFYFQADNTITIEGKKFGV
jgi:hypothetical protein